MINSSFSMDREWLLFLAETEEPRKQKEFMEKVKNMPEDKLEELILFHIPDTFYDFALEIWGDIYEDVTGESVYEN